MLKQYFINTNISYARMKAIPRQQHWLQRNESKNAHFEYIRTESNSADAHALASKHTAIQYDDIF